MALPRFGTQVSTERIPELLAAAQRASAALAAKKDSLSEHMSARELAELIGLYEEASSKLSLADSLADALFSVEMNNTQYRDAQNTVSRVGTEISSELLFFTLTIKQWPAQRLAYYSKELPQYHMWLHRLALYAPYTLSEKEERIILYKDTTGDELLRKVYAMLTASYAYTLEIDGKTLTLNRSELSRYASDPRREVRKAAADALLVPFKKDYPIISELYRGLTEDWANDHIKLRGYKTPIQSRHLGNQIPEQAFEALKAVVLRNRKLFNDYIELKRKILGYDEFTRYDFTAPVEGKPQSVTYEHARKRVLEVFNSFAPWLHDHAEKLFEQGRVDVPSAKNKRSGACCYGLVPGETPLVILNFTGEYDDMATMAHELGHAVHYLLSGPKNNDLTYHAPLVLAETASTFAEALLFEAEVRDASPQVRKALICQWLDDMIATVPAQMRYTRFEMQAHDLVASGASVTELDTAWTELLKEDFPTVKYPDTSIQWTVIPHIFNSPFYCYSYSFGALLVLALYKRYEEEGEAFVPKMEALLSAGGSKAPAEALNALGYDITSEVFWEGGFAVIKKYVDELRTLV